MFGRKSFGIFGCGGRKPAPPRGFRKPGPGRRPAPGRRPGPGPRPFGKRIPRPGRPAPMPLQGRGCLM